VAFEQACDHLTSVSVAPCGFMPLRGQMAKPESVRPLRAGSGLFVNFDGERRLDTAALYTALGHPAELLTTGIRVIPAELFDGLALWLALHEPDSGRLFAVGAAADLGLVPPLLPGMTSTYVLLEEQAMAALVCLDQELDSGTSSSAFELGVRVFGAAGHDLAQRLVGTIHEWHASGRRATAGLRIRAYPPRQQHRRRHRGRHRQALQPAPARLAGAVGSLHLTAGLVGLHPAATPERRAAVPQGERLTSIACRRSRPRTSS
jgi:protein-L-isoaspartate(D-aspartate) O-methyltransferase